MAKRPASSLDEMNDAIMEETETAAPASASAIEEDSMVIDHNDRSPTVPTAQEAKELEKEEKQTLPVPVHSLTFMPEAEDSDVRIETKRDIVNAYDELFSASDKENYTIDEKVAILHHTKLKDKVSKDDVRSVLEDLELPSGVALDAPRGPAAREGARAAFELPYTQHVDDERFIQHLETQRSSYLANEKQTRAPYFAVVQSSGYGKSRMIDNVRKTKHDEYKVVYWSFGTSSVPPANVTLLQKDFKDSPRGLLEAAFAVSIAMALGVEQEGRPKDKLGTSSSSMNEPTYNINKPETIEKDKTKQMVDNILGKVGSDFDQAKEETIFVVDEASKLLHDQTFDGVSFFRCLRKALDDYFSERAPWLFTVVMATFSTITLISPGSEFETSFRPNPGYDDLGPLEPFILGSSFRVNNNEDDLLETSVNECHAPEKLYSMGRPLWKAYLTSPKQAMSAIQMLTYAKQKLMFEEKLPKVAQESYQWTIDQALATLGARVCLAISPQSRYASTLVAGHMGTAFKASRDRLTITMGFPSEPILALAARSLWRSSDNSLKQVISAMTDIFDYSTVDKGYNGEVIVRLLNLLAIDKAMKPPSGDTDQVREVKLRDFLKMFHRDGTGIIDDAFLNRLKGPSADETPAGETAVLRKLGLIDDYNAEYFEKLQREGAVRTDDDENVETILEGNVCFTHFIYLAKKTPITHGLLRLAYRRTAAIVVEAGRRGIDLIIPVRIIDQPDRFFGFVEQVKNRVSDVLEPLIDVSNDETHHKVNHRYFLTPEERRSFVNAGVNMEKHWPSMLFAIGADEQRAAAAQRIVRKRLRSDDQTDIVQFPCIVVTGLGYDFMEADANTEMERLRDFERDLDEEKKPDIPLTYGCSKET